MRDWLKHHLKSWLYPDIQVYSWDQFWARMRGKKVLHISFCPSMSVVEMTDFTVVYDLKIIITAQLSDGEIVFPFLYQRNHMHISEYERSEILTGVLQEICEYQDKVTGSMRKDFPQFNFLVFKPEVKDN